MLTTVAVVLLVLWVLGMVSSTTMGGLIDPRPSRHRDRDGAGAPDPGPPSHLTQSEDDGFENGRAGASDRVCRRRVVETRRTSCCEVPVIAWARPALRRPVGRSCSSRRPDRRAHLPRPHEPLRSRPLRLNHRFASASTTAASIFAATPARVLAT